MAECLNAEIRDRLPDLGAPWLASAERENILAHVQGCDSCAYDLEILRVSRSVLLEATPRIDVATVVASLPAAGRIAARRSIVGRGAQVMAQWRIAAAVALLAVGGGSYALITHNIKAGAAADSLAALSVDQAPGLSLTGRLVDLDDAQLKQLVDQLESIDALPATDVESVGAGVSDPRATVLPDSVLQDLERL